MGFTRKDLGHGIGLRPKHYGRFLAEAPSVDWVEAISENFLAPGGRPYAVLEKVRREVPVVLHGVSLAIGSVDPLDERLLRGLRALADVVSRVGRAQDALGRQILMENVSSYVAYADSTMPEWEFLARVAEEADCGILLDVNNVYVSARNHEFDPDAYLAGIPAGRVGQFHLAGHSDHGTHLLDTHDAPVTGAVWELYRSAVRRFGSVPALVEWDDHVPELEVVVEESRRARAIEKEALA